MNVVNRVDYKLDSHLSLSCVRRAHERDWLSQTRALCNDTNLLHALDQSGSTGAGRISKVTDLVSFWPFGLVNWKLTVSLPPAGTSEGAT